MVQKCQHYLPIKKRTCKFEAKPGFIFCGNHMPNDLQPTRKRVRCPWDPSHTVFESDLAQHEFKCPSHLFRISSQAQAFCVKDVNTGSSDSLQVTAHQLLPNDSTHEQPTASPAQLRHRYLQALHTDEFLHLVHRITATHAQICSDEQPVQYLELEACQAHLQPDNHRPFSLKHAQQQASIVGHMQQIGLLQNAEGRVYIEFGAGRGYLSSMLADASDARNFVLLDVRGFRNKADRSLRQLESLRLQRLRVDIKDFQPAGVDGLNGGQAPWVATGKHLCGAATDFTLRCVASSMHATGSHLHQAKTTEPQTAQPSAVDGAQSPAIIAVDTDQSSEYISDLPNAPCHGSIAMKLDRDRTDACSSDSAQFGSDVAEDAKSCCSRGAHTGDGAGVQGFAVATCCHHRCSWQHYVGKPLFQQLGFSPDEFEIISWMTGWALCGHETPAGQAQDNQTESMHCNVPVQAPSARYVVQQQAGTGNTEAAHAAVSTAGSKSASETANQSEPIDAAAQLSRDRRIDLGQKCKQVIDKGREQWLRQQGFQVQSVLYVDPKVSGENRLLLGIARSTLPNNI